MTFEPARAYARNKLAEEISNSLCDLISKRFSLVFFNNEGQPGSTRINIVKGPIGVGDIDVTPFVSWSLDERFLGDTVIRKIVYMLESKYNASSCLEKFARYLAEYHEANSSP